MAKSFADLKKGGRSSMDELKQKLEKTTGAKNREVDERFWTLTVDKTGNGHATIRFLPAAPGEDVPFVQFFSHGFQGIGGWYIENCLSTVGKDDPVNQLNIYYYDKLSDDQAAAKCKGRFRKTHYIANIVVVDDPSNPDNNGKVFLYKFGKKRKG